MEASYSRTTDDDPLSAAPRTPHTASWLSQTNDGRLRGGATQLPRLVEAQGAHTYCHTGQSRVRSAPPRSSLVRVRSWWTTGGRVTQAGLNNNTNTQTQQQTDPMD